MHRVIELGVPARRVSAASGALAVRGLQWPRPTWLHGAGLGALPLDCAAADGTGALLLSAVALPLVALLAVWAGFLWGRQQHAESLREARSQAERMRQLLDVWHWQTDSEHRLIRWQPPLPAPASAWKAATGAALWERFELADAGPQGDPAQALRSRLDGRAPLLDLPVQCQNANGTEGWRLRAVPRFDARGLFAGYDGTARLAAAAPLHALDEAGLETLIQRIPAAALMGARDRVDGNLRVCRCNEPAARMTGAAPGMLWPQMLAGLPDALRRAVVTLEPAGNAVECGFSVHLERLPDEGRLLLLLPAVEAAAESQAPAEHESFSTIVSHDLRAPIRVVEGFTRILKEDYGRVLDRIGNDHLDRVLGAAARMNGMIDSLLALAQLSSQPLARQPVNLSQLAGYVIEDLRRQHPQQHAEVHVQPAMMAIGDPTLLRIVLENLLGNAWKYSARNAQAEIGFETVQHEGRVAYLVRDNGAGFDMRFADRLFHVFQRLHSANDFQGTGVGLASVRRIVRRHGGDVWADAEVGRGARFLFTLRL
jgi:signal transduction histidine kinase